MVDAINNPHRRYLINDARVLTGREPKTAEMTNSVSGVSGRGGGPIPLVNDCATGTEGQLTVYNHWGGGATDAYTPSPTLRECNHRGVGGATDVYTPSPTLWE